MKRTNLVLDEETLKRATQILGVKTYSEAVNRALVQTIQLAEIREMVGLMGSVEWEGDLGEMREDHRGTVGKKTTTKKNKKSRS